MCQRPTSASAESAAELLCTVVKLRFCFGNALTTNNSIGDSFLCLKLNSSCRPFNWNMPLGFSEVSRSITSLLRIGKQGVGFFADAYDLFVIDIVLAILSRLSADGDTTIDVSSSRKAALSLATSLGAVIGMMLFGFLGDHIGILPVAMCTASLVIFGSLASAFVSSSFGDLTLQLLFCRLVLGFGIGGEYPLSAAIAYHQHHNSTVMNNITSPTLVDIELPSSADNENLSGNASEPALSEHLRLSNVASVFAMQGVGMIVSPLLAILLIECRVPLSTVWRLLLGFAALPSAAALWIRFQVHRASGTGDDSAQSKIVVGDRLGGLVPHMSLIAVTASTWCVLDATFYGTGQFKSLVARKAISEAASLDAPNEVLQESVFALLVGCVGLPGYLAASWMLKNKWDPWLIQRNGFVLVAGSYVALVAVVVNNASMPILFLAFAITFFVTNAGPNTTTFVLPAHCFPTTIRTFANGLSAACGKLGAVAGATLFGIGGADYLAAVLVVCVALATVGALITWQYERRRS